MSPPREFWTDARHYQIAALSTLLAFNFGWLDFGARPLNSALAIAGALATQALCTWYYAPTANSDTAVRPWIFDPRSPLITGLSLSLLLRADEPWLHFVAAIFHRCVECSRDAARSIRVDRAGVAVISDSATVHFSHVNSFLLMTVSLRERVG